MSDGSTPPSFQCKVSSDWRCRKRRTFYSSVVDVIGIPIELSQPRRFLHRQSDDTLHWKLGGVEPPDMAAARAEESRQDANQRERIWYVACTRARDLLILPYIPQAPKSSWFASIDLKQTDVPELD